MLLKKNDEYPLFLQNLLDEYPSWDEGQSMPVGWSLVLETAPPKKSPGYIVKESFPELVDGKWQQAWSIVKLSPSDIQNMAKEDDKITEKYSPSSPPQL